MRIELAADVLFEFDKATLQPEAEATLTKAAAFIRDRSANLRLSQRRAESVRKWFAGHGLGGLKFSVEGLGETRPVAANTKPDGSDDPAGREKNRRVEIVIAKGR
ncbi:Photosystem I chlorophyll a apoprotein A2 [compost metagenome]